MTFKSKKPTSKEILHFYQKLAPVSALDSPNYQRLIIEEWLKQLSSNLNLKKMYVLDFGCGKGNNLKVLCRNFNQITACDISSRALQLAREATQHKNINFIRIKEQILPFKEGQFDFIMATEVLEHVPNLKKTFLELDRIIKKNGYILISTPNYWNLRGLSKKFLEFFLGEGRWDPGRSHVGGYERFMTPTLLLKLLAKNYNILETRGSDYGTAWSPPMVKMYPKRFDNFFEITLGKVGLFKKFGMNYYLLAQTI